MYCVGSVGNIKTGEEAEQGGFCGHICGFTGLASGDRPLVPGEQPRARGLDGGSASFENISQHRREENETEIWIAVAKSVRFTLFGRASSPCLWQRVTPAPDAFGSFRADVRNRPLILKLY